MYAAFLPEWRASLPPHHLLVMRTEDQIAHPLRVVRRATAHLGLRALTPRELQAIRAVRAEDELDRVRMKYGMPSEPVLSRVRRFYRPFNRALARQLADDAFLWKRGPQG